MNEMAKMVADLINKKTVIEEGDYVKDGLLYCGKCNTPKQCKTFILGKERIVSCNCDCKAAAYEKKQAEFEQNNRKIYIDRLKANGIQDREILRYTFENDDNSNSKITELMKKYVNHWDEMYANNTGMLLWGNVGSGKTFYAGCVGNALISKGVPVMITDFAKILGRLQELREGRNSFLKELNNFKLLIIDDLEAERQSDYALEQIFTVIDQRYKNGQPVIFTTNVPIEEMKNPKDVRYGRIYDRILEMCLPIKLSGVSRRMQKAESKLNDARQILYGGKNVKED